MIGNQRQREIDVFVQDPTSPLFQWYLQQVLKDDITLTAPISVDDSIVNVSSGHGFATPTPPDYDELITIVEGDAFEQAQVVSVTGDAITMSIPSPAAFTTSAKVIRGNKKLNLNGSVTPIEALFKFYDPTAIVPIDISKVILTMAHVSPGDDGKFGGITALPNGGIYFRRVNDQKINLGNYVNNQGFKDRGAIVTYTAKGPAGTNSTDIVFDIKTIFGQVLRLSPSHLDEVCSVIRNDLTGLTNLYISLIGSYTEGET